MAGRRGLRVWIVLLVLAAFELGTVRAAYGAACLKAASSASPARSAPSDRTVIDASTIGNETGPTDPSHDSAPAQPAAGSCPGAPLVPGECVRTGDAGHPKKDAVPAADERAGPEVALAPPFHPPRTI